MFLPSPIFILGPDGVVAEAPPSFEFLFVVWSNVTKKNMGTYDKEK